MSFITTGEPIFTVPGLLLTVFSWITSLILSPDSLFCWAPSLLNKPSPLGKHLQALGAKLRRWLRSNRMRSNPTGLFRGSCLSLPLWGRWARCARMRSNPTGLFRGSCHRMFHSCASHSVTSIWQQASIKERRWKCVRQKPQGGANRLYADVACDYAYPWNHLHVTRGFPCGLFRQSMYMASGDTKLGGGDRQLPPPDKISPYGLNDAPFLPPRSTNLGILTPREKHDMYLAA